MKKIAVLCATLALASCTIYQHYSNQVSSPLMFNNQVVGQVAISLDSEEPEQRIRGLVMTATTSDNEVFTGTIVVDHARVMRPRGRVEIINTHGRSAVLTGSLGHNMSCQFNAADRNSNIINGGAVGSCQISDGRYFSFSLVTASVETDIPVSAFDRK